METLDQIRTRLLARFPEAKITLVANPGPAAEHSLLLDHAHARDIAFFLRDAAGLRFDYCSNVTGVDWPGKEVVETAKAPTVAAAVSTAATGAERVSLPPAASVELEVPGFSPGSSSQPTTTVAEKAKRFEPGCLEAVYHLYSMELKHGPLIVRLRTANRTDQVTLPSLTPVWRSCEFQEREIFDLFGVVFEGHPDLRRILMWEGFKDHPMRKDYVPPDDFEWEPTPHGDVLTRAQKHFSGGRA